MSVTFTMNGKRKLSGEPDIMTIGEALGFSGLDLWQYSFDADEIEGFYEAKLSRPECLLVGVEEKSMRGFELSCDEEENQYYVRVFTPSTIGDWEVALAFIQAMAHYLDSEIIAENGVVYSPDNIGEYPYRQDILCGIRAMQGRDKYQIFGLYRPVSFDAGMIRTMMEAEDPAQAFGEMTTFIQYLNAYSAKQKFYRYENENEEEKLIGSYTLTQDTPTILPYQPMVEYENMDVVDANQIELWQMVLVGIDGDPDDQDSYFVMEHMPYEDFIQGLPQDKYRFIDAEYILVEACNREELEALLEE